jgi:hypothetical protein
MTKPEHPELRIPAPEAIQRIANSEDRKLAWVFFVFFSRMEFALKRTGYLERPRKADGPLKAINAKASWDEFGNRWGTTFDQKSSKDLAVAVNYFRGKPPRKQIVENNTLDWSPPEDGQQVKEDELLKWLLVNCVCRVRNNLFHGGKFPDPVGPVPDPGRDRDLIHNSMVILSAALSLDPNVMVSFSEAIED